MMGKSCCSDHNGKKNLKSFKRRRRIQRQSLNKDENGSLLKHLISQNTNVERSETKYPIVKMYHNIKVTIHTGEDIDLSLDEENFERFTKDYDYRTSLISQLSAQAVQNEAAKVGHEHMRGNEETESFTYGHSQSSQQFLEQMPREMSQLTSFSNIGSQKKTWSVEDEETLIRHVMERPPLFNHKIPLKQRTRNILKNLWREIIEEMHVDLDEEAISKKWKNLRDSYMRARSIINRRSSCGSFCEQWLHAERVRKNHKHYELLTFLDSSLAERRTISNLESTSGASTDRSCSPVLPETSSISRARQGELLSSRGRQGQLSMHDEAFLGAIKDLRPVEKREENPIQQFCSRLADGLSKLPRKVSNQLQVEFLSKLVEQENLYLE